jgi:atypical dual specificity phosphatase
VVPDEPPFRPHGYVEDVPVVRRIGARDLYLGNVHAADPDRHDRSFDFVLSATRDPQPLTTHHHPIVDGPEIEWPRFEAAVDTTRDLFRRDGSLLVHCTAGISRSTTLVATTLAAEEELSLSDALDAVTDVRPFAQPHPSLHELAVVYLAARG